MSKSVLISIRPKWCELIASGKKTIEVRKTVPKLEVPFKCYIYCTQTKTIGDIILCKSEENAKLFGYNTVKGINKGFAEKEDIQLKGKVIGEFVCDKVLYFPYMTNPNNEHEKVHWISRNKIEETCLTYEEIANYGKGKTLYGWHISDLKIYDKPKELSEFKTICEGIKCDGCEYYYVENNESVGLFKDCLCGCEKPIKRPPQSWGYCEELEK